MQIKNSLSSDQFDPQKEIVLEKDIDKNLGLKSSSYQITKDDSDSIEIQTNTNGNSLMVISDSFYPGWQATIDNQKTEILAADANWQAIFLPEGNHQITMSYQPLSLKIGASLSLTFAIFLTVMWIKFRQKQI